jgi:hypothetical protein
MLWIKVPIDANSADKQREDMQDKIYSLSPIKCPHPELHLGPTRAFYQNK